MKIKYLIYLLVVFVLCSCSTFTATKSIAQDPQAQPQNFEESLIVAQTQFAATRDVAAMALRTGLITKTVAQNIADKTRDFRAQLDLIKTAYSGAASIADCKIEFPPGSGIQVPCQDRTDQILAGLLLVQQILETKQ